VIVWSHKDVTEQDRKILHASVQAVVQKESGAKALLEELHHYLVPPHELEALGAFSRQGAPAKEPSAVLGGTKEVEP
jgi:hypothetical protein